MAIPDDRQQFGRFEWERVLRRADLPYTVKCMGLMIATYASADGGDMFPGRERLAAEAGLSPRQVSRHLDALRDVKLLTVTKMHNRQAGRADEYVLTVPVDVASLNLLGPDELTREDSRGLTSPAEESPRHNRGSSDADPHYVTSVSSLGDTSDALCDTDDATTGHECHPTTSVPLMDQPNINHGVLSTSLVGGADVGDDEGFTYEQASKAVQARHGVARAYEVAEAYRQAHGLDDIKAATIALALAERDRRAAA